MKMDINQYDGNGLRHGICELYYKDSRKLGLRGKYKKGNRHGFFEYYQNNGQLGHKGEYKNSKRMGLWYEDRYEY